MRLARVRDVPRAGEALGFGDPGGAKEPHRLHRPLSRQSIPADRFRSFRRLCPCGSTQSAVNVGEKSNAWSEPVPKPIALLVFLLLEIALLPITIVGQILFFIDFLLF